MFLALSITDKTLLALAFEVMDAANQVGANFANDDQRHVQMAIGSTDDSFTDGWIEAEETVIAALKNITGTAGEFMSQYVQDDLLSEVRYLSSLSYVTLGTGTAVALVHNTDAEVILIADGSRGAIHTTIADLFGKGFYEQLQTSSDVKELYYNSAFKKHLSWKQFRDALPISVIAECPIAVIGGMSAYSGDGIDHVSLEFWGDMRDRMAKSGLDNCQISKEDWTSIKEVQLKITELQQQCIDIINKHARW